jgi:hypothetical protein
MVPYEERHRELASSKVVIARPEPPLYLEKERSGRLFE